MAASSLFGQILRLTRHSLVYGLGAAASQLAGFFLIPLYSEYLIPADYGVFEIFLATAAVLSVIIPLGVNSGLAMSYYEHDDPDSRKRALSSAWIVVSLSSLVIIGILEALAGQLSSVLFGSGQYASHLRIVFAAVFLDAGVMQALLVLRVQEKSFSYVTVTLIRLFSSIGLTILFVVGLDRGLMGILVSQLIVSGALYLLIIPRLVWQSGVRFSAAKARSMMLFGMPFVPSNLAAWTLNLANRYLLQFLSTATQVGLYSMGSRFGMVVNALVVSPFALAWGPFFWAVAKEENAKKVYSLTLTYFSLVAVCVGLAVSVLSKEVLAIMSTPPYYSAYRVIPLVSLSYVLLGSYTILASGMIMMKKTKWVPLITGIAAACNLGLNFLLIPRYGMMGAAWASLGSYLLLPIGGFLISRRYYTIDYEWGRVTKILLAAAAIYAASVFAGESYSLVQSHALVGLFKLLILLTYPLLLYLFGFFRPEEISKVKEIVRSAPGYLLRRLTGARDTRE